MSMTFFYNFRNLDKKLSLSLTLILLSYLLTLPNLGLGSGFNRLEKVGFSTLPGNRVQINLDFSSPVSAPLTFSTDNPARIVLDFPNTKVGLDKKSLAIGIGAVEGTSTVETKDRARGILTRVVLNLVRMVPFDIQTLGNRIYIAVENITTTTTPSSSSTLVPTHSSPPTSLPIQSQTIAKQSLTVGSQSLPIEDTIMPVPYGPSIKNIDFRRIKKEKGAGKIIVDLSDPTIVVDMHEKSNDIVVDFLDTVLPEKLDRRLEVTDFATPVTIIDTSQQGENVRMVITAVGDYEYLAYQAEDTYTVEVKEITEEKKATVEAKKPKFTGQKVSFNFQDIDIRAALLLLTDLPGVNLNMVVPDHVTGSVTLRLKNVPWDQALDIILEANQLGMEQIGNVIMIDKQANIDKRKQELLAAQQAIKKLEPLHTEHMQINYAKASDIEKLIKTRDEHSFLSDRGSVSVDERTNKLIIQDTAERISEIRELISSLDGPTRQVLIESRVVIANDTFSKNLGVKFGYSANQDLGDGYGLVIGGKMGGSNEFAGGTGFTSDNTTPYGEGQGENFIVSLPAAGPAAALGLAIGKIGSYLLQLELSAAESEGTTKIISNPRIITGNQREAIILQGTEIPYRTTSLEGTKVEFKQANLELRVTPQITPDDRIIMDLQVNSDKVSEITNEGSLAIDKREIKTQVLVDNGETLVLGGIYEQESRDAINRIPFLSDIPWVGDLFKSRSNRNEKRELLIFVTPKIVKETT